ncbi:MULTISPECIES: hypothetical protein [Streptomyces]|uniref:hypothetical protein n=1 Tax=Streptomyces scabiei TaxID=1930 RepID=UPI000A49B9C7|nr:MULTISPECIES: hypothetical protein [Streptomyces]MDW8478066.1 hypothetical protein [Streptomyces scabiei]MDX2568387.1 hypothetical protein [Streptomyces scabiei]MDX2627210.1 hypothetical protein [Streptomyces scabiei]MDX2836915.1 hypothetical protein [Streptomyces scabiei]MDX3029528.1 hypothetical protein [Streptomyces scabiei]
MSYRLHAAISDFDRLRSWAAGVSWATVAPLAQRSGLLVLPSALGDDLVRTLGDLSQGGPVAHVEAAFWAGDGHQTASLWRSGVLEWGPVHTAEFGGPHEERPINAELARLGVDKADPCAADHRDLFLEVGLGRRRDDQDWREAALRASDTADYDEWSARERAASEREERAAAERARYERLPGVPVALDGKEIIALLGVPQGRTVGAAIRVLQQLHLERGPLSREEAEVALVAWAAEHGSAPATSDEPGSGDPIRA